MKTLKQIFLFCSILLLTQSCIVSERPNMDFFSSTEYDFQDAKFTSFKVPLLLAKPYIKKALRENDDSEAAIAMIKKVSKIKIMTVENGSRKMMKDFTDYLNNNNYQDWATIRHDGENVNIRVKQKGEAIKNMLITVNSDKELVFLDVKGNFTAADISQLINSASDK